MVFKNWLFQKSVGPDLCPGTLILSTPESLKVLEDSRDFGSHLNTAVSASPRELLEIEVINNTQCISTMNHQSAIATACVTRKLIPASFKKVQKTGAKESCSHLLCH